MKKVQFRQGDVFVEKISQLPTALTEVKKDQGRVVLAYGEVTGHAHAIIEKTAKSYIDPEGNLFLELGTDSVLQHEEHGHISLEKGFYRVIRQREYSPEEIRIVGD
jgi:hypothetical protein